MKHAAAGGRHVALLSRQGELWTAGAAMQVDMEM
jgi:alpha-tubulin suppressor-like RCC1 family protein